MELNRYGNRNWQPRYRILSKVKTIQLRTSNWHVNLEPLKVDLFVFLPNIKISVTRIFNRIANPLTRKVLYTGIGVVRVR